MIEVVESQIEDILKLLRVVLNDIVAKRNSGQYELYQKEDGTVLTSLDLHSQALIVNGLREIFGQIDVLSEENAFDDNLKILMEDFFFLLDPIDGTRSFVAGGAFSINLSFCVYGVPKLSFIFSSNGDIVFNDRQSVYRQTADGKISKITKTTYKLGSSLNIVTSSGVKDRHINFFKAEISSRGYTNVCLYYDPALTKFIHFLEDDIDAIVLIGKSKDWDILPMVPIVEKLNMFYANGFDATNKKITVNTKGDFSFPLFILTKDKVLLEDILFVCQKL